MRFNSDRVNRLRNILAIILLISYFGAQAHAGEMVPLKGSFSGGIINENFDSKFHGHFTHMGQIEGSLDNSTGIATWVAPNGDTINNETTFFAFGEEVSPGIFLYVQEITLTGGTGRFSNTVGSATSAGTWNIDTLEFDGFTTGTMSRPNRRP
jgi:hypothetical protein